jgi:hypothetical protein
MIIYIKKKTMEQEKEKITSGEKETGKKKKSSLFKILAGDILTEDFVVKQSKMVLWVVFLILIFISNRYSCVKKLAEIQELKTQLEYLEYENLVISTELTSRCRQSQIEHFLNEKGINLSLPQRPAIEIRK